MRIFLFILLVQQISFAQISSTTWHPTVTHLNTKDVLFHPDSLISHSKKHLGKRYRYRGVSPKTGFDCSGFVYYNFKRYGLILPHSSISQIKYGEKIKKETAKPGDLIFFKGSSVKSKLAGHVGIVVKVHENYITFIHSAHHGGIRYDRTDSPYYKRRFMGIRRLSNNYLVSDTISTEKM